MMASLRAEFRKLFSVRSTYYIFGLVLVALLFFAFYANGIKADATALSSPSHLSDQATQAISALAGFIGLVGLLLMAHEYRYNTIMYTFTASNSRARILLAKLATVTCFALATTLVVSVLSPAFSAVGIRLAGHHLVPQAIVVKTLLWHCLFFGWGYAMMALLLATLIRNQVGAIAAFFLVPGPVEALAGLLLKQNTVYLPFTALGQVIAAPKGQREAMQHVGHLSPEKAALVFGVYLVVGWIVAWILFLRRDAN